MRLAAKCPDARILACEINPTLARDNRANLAAAGINGRVKVVADAAEHMLAQMSRRKMEKPDFIISSIPLGNLNKRRVVALIEAISEALGHGGLYIQYQHSLLDRKKIRTRFSSLRTVPVLLNVPPAVVYYASK